MELNEMHTEHEHATTSLKVVLLVFAIVLVGALGYLVWAANVAPDTTDNSAATANKTETTKTDSSPTTYTAPTFSFTIPVGYSVAETVSIGSTAGVNYTLQLLANDGKRDGVLKTIPIKIVLSPLGAPSTAPTIDEALAAWGNFYDKSTAENVKDFTNGVGTKIKSFSFSGFGGTSYGAVAVDKLSHYRLELTPSLHIAEAAYPSADSLKTLYDKVVATFKLTK